MLENCLQRATDLCPTYQDPEGWSLPQTSLGHIPKGSELDWANCAAVSEESVAGYSAVLHCESGRY